jgi:hypothetical protein
MGSRNRNSGQFNYTNYNGSYGFNGSLNMSLPGYTINTKGASNRITITNMNSGNRRVSVSPSNSNRNSMNMTLMRNSLPTVIQRNNVNIASNNPRRLSRNGGFGGAQLHPNDYNMLRYLNGLPTRTNMSGNRRNNTR